tara:strand:- start:170 stop:550 length:381 start_codon:yes stop_codon:yes gene_type:complete
MSNTPLFENAVMKTTCGAKGIKFEEENANFVHQKISLPMCKRIQKARSDAGLTQKQLAQKMNVKASLIQSYENGTGIPVGRVVQCIEKACDIPFGTISGKPPRKKKKKKMKISKVTLIKTKPRSIY